MAEFYDSGQIILKGEYYEVPANEALNPPADAFVVKESDTVVAYIDASTGNMYVRSAAEHQVVTDDSNNAYVLRFEGVPVLTINNTGNLKCWRNIIIPIVEE